MHLVIEEHADSIESIKQNGHIVKLVGKGIMKSPGHPAGNQCYERQIPLLKLQNVPIYNKDFNKKIEYLGLYRILTYEIKISFEGFRYFLFTMVRKHRNIPGEEHVFPAL